jgi:hypothetical protein
LSFQRQFQAGIIAFSGFLSHHCALAGYSRKRGTQ